MDKNNLKKIIDLRHELHMYPELSNEEYETKKRLINFLKENTDLEIIDKGKWFYAVHYSGDNKSNIAFRADFDALPMSEGIDLPHASKNEGVSHKCGHDGHSAALAGLALEIDQNKPDKNVYLLFQHAEETGDGAKEAVEMVHENNIEELYGFHNWSGLEEGSINIMNGVCQYASKGLIIEIEGSPTHASEPELGVNPAYTIAKIISSLDELTSKDNNEGEVLATVVQIELGEEAFGIAASEGKLLLTIRAKYQEEMERLEENIKKIIIEDAKSLDLKFKIKESDVFPETANHEVSANKVREVARKLDYKLVEMEKPFRSSEDFGYYTQATEGALFYIGNGLDYPGIHTYEYDFPDKNLEIAVNMFKGLIDLE